MASVGSLCGAVSSTGNARPVPRGRVLRQTTYKIAENTMIRNHQGAFSRVKVRGVDSWK